MPRGRKLFVPDGVHTDIAIQRFRQYLCKVRPHIQDGGSTRPITHHGPWHSYAAHTFVDQVYLYDTPDGKNKKGTIPLNTQDGEKEIPIDDTKCSSMGRLVKHWAPNPNRKLHQRLQGLRFVSRFYSCR